MALARSAILSTHHLHEQTMHIQGITVRVGVHDRCEPSVQIFKEVLCCKYIRLIRTKT